MSTELPNVTVNKKTRCPECNSEVELLPQPLFSEMAERFERWYQFFSQGAYPAERIVDLTICAVQEEGDFVISDNIAKQQDLRSAKYKSYSQKS